MYLCKVLIMAVSQNGQCPLDLYSSYNHVKFQMSTSKLRQTASKFEINS